MFLRNGCSTAVERTLWDQEVMGLKSARCFFFLLAVLLNLNKPLYLEQRSVYPKMDVSLALGVGNLALIVGLRWLEIFC